MEPTASTQVFTEPHTSQRVRIPFHGYPKWKHLCFLPYIQTLPLAHHIKQCVLS